MNPPSAEPGWQTTEFWITAVTVFLSMLIAFHIVHVTNDQIQAVAGMAGMAIPVAIYAIGRGIRKQGTQK